MLEIPSRHNCGQNLEPQTLYGIAGFDYFQEHEGKKVSRAAFGGNWVNDLLRKSSLPDIEDEINEPSIFKANFERKNIPKDQRLNGIFHTCLEPEGFGDHLSLTSPKNFAVQYFTVSQNHPVTICRRSQCPFTAHGLRTQEKTQQPACSELSRCKRSQIATQDQFSHCVSLPKEIQNASAESTPCTASVKKGDDSNREHNIPRTSTRQGYNATFNSRSCCPSKLSGVESLRVKKNHTLQQTDPEQSWQARCSSFIINLPLTLSEKLFGPRTTWEPSKDGKRTISDEDSGIKCQPVSENTFIPSSRDQGNKKSVKSRPSSLGDRGCNKNVGTDRVFVEKANQVEPCYLTATQSLQKGIRCRISSRKSEKSATTCKKLTSECGQSCDDSFSRFGKCANYSDGLRSRGSESREPRLKGRPINQTRSSISEGKKTPSRFSNWPAVLSEKIFGPRNEKVPRCCDVEYEARHAKATDGVADCTEIVTKIGKPSAAKNGRLLLKKYTISQTPEAMEETLCFDILTSEQLTETRTELQSSDDKRKLETIQERDEVLGKRFRTGRSHTSKRCMKSRGNVSKLSSRKTEQREEKNSTERICLSSLIMKMLNRNRKDKYASQKEECCRNTATGQNRDKGDQRGRKCAFKQRTNTALRKYATTSIHKHRHKSVKCPRYVGKYSRKKEAVPCSLKRDALSPTFRTIIDSPDISGEDGTQKQIPSHFVSGRKEVFEQGSARVHLFEDNLENGCRDRLKNKLINEEEYQNCDSCGSSNVKKSFAKSRVLQVIDKRRTSRPENYKTVESDLREERCERIQSPKKLACKVLRQNEIEHNDLQSACRGRNGGETLSQRRGTTEEGFCTQGRQDISVSQKGFGNYGSLRESGFRKVGKYRKNNLILARMEKRSRKRCHREQFPKARICKRLIIVDENEIADPTRRQMFVIADDDICVRMFNDRETCTDELLGSEYCQRSTYAEERIPNQELMCTRTILGGDTKDAKNCSPPNQKTEQSGLTQVIRNSDRQDSAGFYPQSRSPEEGPILDGNGNGSMQKLAENAMRIRVGCEECVGSFCGDDACSVRPRGISEREDILEAEQDVGTVCSSLWQEVRGERGNTVRGGETCLYKTLIKSATKDALGILKADEFCQRQSMVFQVNDLSPSLVTAKSCSPEDTGNSSDESRNRNQGRNDDQQLSKASPRKSERMDEINPRTNTSEKRNSWIKSPGKDLVVTRPESRNIINSYYSQKKIVLPSGPELARNNEHAKVKNGKVQRDGGASEKSITKARTPFQRIENFRQVGCDANALIKDDKSKKRDDVEKENRIVDKKSQFIQGGRIFNDDSKNYLVQNIAIDDSSLPNDSTTVSTAGRVDSTQKSMETDFAVNPETRPTPTKIREKSGPLKENKTSERVSASARKASESSSGNLKESSRKGWLGKGNSTTASTKTGAKGRAREAGKIAESAKSESSNRLAGSIDTYDRKRREGHKESKAPAYTFDKENIKPRSLQIEISSVEELNVPNDAIGKGTGWNAKGRESSESGKSSSLRRNGERRENDRSRGSSAAKETKENKQTKVNQSKSKTEGKKNEKDEKSAPLKLSSQIDFGTDASTSRQRLVTMNADLFSSALMDGKNKIKNHRDLQSAGEENSNSNRILTSKDEGLRKSATATAQSKSKVLKSYKSSKTDAEKTPGKSKSDKKSRILKEYVDEGTQTANVADEGETDNISPSTSPASVHMENSGEELTENSGHDKVDVTGDSPSVEMSNAKSCRSATCKNNANRERDFGPGSSARNPKKVEHLESAALPKNILSEDSSVPTASKAPNHERASCGSRMPPYHAKNGTQTSSSGRSSDPNRKTKQEARGNVLPPGSPPCRTCKDRKTLKLNHAEARVTNMASLRKQGIQNSARREDAEKKAKELITEIEHSLVSKIKCEKSMDSESNENESKRPCKYFRNSSNEEDKQIEQRNDVADELTTLCTSERTINDSSDRNYCFTDDVKRLLDQGQEFLSSKRRKNSDQTTLCSDIKREPRPCGGFKSNESKACCTGTTKSCKNVDSEKLKNCLGICADDRASSNSISSLEKAYSTLKTKLLNKTRCIKESFMNAKETKETQIRTSTLDESSTLASPKCKLPRIEDIQKQ